MQLILTENELDELITGGYVKPNIENSDEFILTLVAINGRTREITVLPTDTIDEPIVSKAVYKTVSSDNGHSSVEDWIDSWRAAWKGKRVKGMGNRDNCVKNMQEFFQLYPKFNQDHVFKARDRYFLSLDGDLRYLEQADYFIKKRVPSNDGGIETRRTLLVYCEELLIDEELGLSDESFNLYEDL